MPMPVVGHGELDDAVDDAQPHVDPAAGVGVLHGVGDEVVEHLPNPAVVDDGRHLARGVDGERHAGGVRDGLRRLHDLAGHEGDVGGAGRQQRWTVPEGRRLQQVGHQVPQPVGVALHHLDLVAELGREALGLEEQLEVPEHRGERAAQLVRHVGDEVLLRPQRAHQVGDVLVREGGACRCAVRVAHQPCRHRQRAPGPGVGADPDPVVVELLAPDRAHRRHLVVAEQGGGVVGEHLPELARLPGMSRGVRLLDEVAVAQVHLLVVTVLVEQHEADVDGVEDRLRLAALAVDDAHRLGEPLAVGLLDGDVDDLADEVQRGAVLPAQQRDRQVAPHHRAVGVQVALEHAVAAPLAGEGLLEEVEVGLEVGGVGDLREGQHAQLVLGVAQHRAQRPVRGEQLPRRADDRHPHGRVFERRPPEALDARLRLVHGHPRGGRSVASCTMAQPPPTTGRVMAETRRTG